MAQQPPDEGGQQPGSPDPSQQQPPGYQQQSYPQSGQYGAPPGAGSSEERTWAMLCHISAFAGLVFPLVGSILGPLVVWQMKREQFPLVDDQGKEALNFNISVFIYSVVCFILFFVVIGIFLAIALGVFWLVVVIMGAIKANEGQAYRYPLCIRFVT